MRVAVLAGGCSLEHDVSLRSAAQVLEKLDRRRHEAWPVLLTPDGRWWPARAPLLAHEAFEPQQRASLHGPLRPGAALAWLQDHAGVDVVFPVLHGAFGEDGTVQGMLELHGLPFVGSGCAASAVAMDKLRTRQVFAAGGVPLADSYEPGAGWRRRSVREEFERLRAAISVPAFVKGDVSGSTVGVARVASEQDLEAFLATYGGRFRRWFAERAVVGEEITVAVLGNAGSDLQPLPPVGIYPVDDDWFTHDAKYRPGATEEIVPPRGLSPARILQVQQLATRCHELLVCDGMSRTDMIVTADGPVVLETNTIPGLTRESLLPRAAAAAGLSFAEMLDRLLELALERHRAADGAGARRHDGSRDASKHAGDAHSEEA